jgi:hypothetical protein
MLDSVSEPNGFVGLDPYPPALMLYRNSFGTLS